MEKISIAGYRQEWQCHFERLNKEWIEKYFVLEEADRQVLEDPEGTLLGQGGRILFALSGDRVVGTVGLKYVDGPTMELTKMAIDSAFQGLGIGTILCQSAIILAKRLRVQRLVLFTQSSLKPAIGLYEKMGFRRVTLKGADHQRADLKMELLLGSHREHGSYPIGAYVEPEMITEGLRSRYIRTIASLPKELGILVRGMEDRDLDVPYRKGGWTVRQVVHHLADSNINCFARIKFALTEIHPTVKPFGEMQWAESHDAKDFPIEASLYILRGIHSRWAALLETLEEEDWKRTFFHPDLGRSQSVEQAMSKYDWHCRHHLAHIAQTKIPRS